MAAVAGVSLLQAAPRRPTDAAEVLAELPAGARHATVPAQALTANRLDVALPLAKFDISRARATGDLRFLGYAEGILAPWMRKDPVPPDVLVLSATILQSRHAFTASLAELDRALQARPQDAQGWLTRATVLRVLGRYDEALQSCGKLEGVADPVVTTLCRQSLLGLSGHLQEAYSSIAGLSASHLPPEVQAWRYSELGEMAARLGRDEAAVHWLREGLQLSPEDFYTRSALADVLLRQGQPAAVLELLAGRESMEPMLLRIAIAHRALQDPAGEHANALLSAAFAVEEQRGEAIHRREQARFLLDIDGKPQAALAAAEDNWRVQREPDDALILLRAARAARRSDAVAAVEHYLQQTRMEDARLAPYRSAS